MEVLSRLVGITIGSRTNRWREALEQQAYKVFETPQEDKRELKQLKAQNERLLHKVGQLTIDCDFFCTSLRGCRSQSEIADLEQHRPAGMCRHRYCHMMHLTRSNLYYKKKGESEQNLRLMQEIDRYNRDRTSTSKAGEDTCVPGHFTEHPTTGRQGMTEHLKMIG